jgi:hypothetical protein
MAKSEKNPAAPQNPEEKKSGAAKSGMIEIKFLKSPTGAYNLAYNAGDVGSVEKELAEKLIESGFAQAV